MDTKMQIVTLLIHGVVGLKIRDEMFIEGTVQAKLYASKVSHGVANEDIRIRGNYGYTENFAIKRCYHDTKPSEIYEEMSETLRNTINGRL